MTPASQPRSFRVKARNHRQEASAQSLAVAAGPRAREDQAFIDAISADGDDEARRDKGGLGAARGAS